MFKIRKIKCKAYRFLPICLFFFILFANNIFASEAENEYLSQLINNAEAKRLYNDRYWNILLHYKPIMNGKESLIDDPVFFLAPDGKKNPQAELKATLQSFFRTPKNDNEHPRCRFPARYFWLKETLGIDEQKLPVVSCNKVKETLHKIEPPKAALIYPSAYIRGPGAMFGHTLLRIDSKTSDDLLSYAVNYAAIVPQTTNVLTYIYKGISGGFKGYYSLKPYYSKIKEYNDLEQRDIWEYELNLTAEEVQNMVLHILELQDIYSDYHFLGENCAFNLLFLLEAARPSLKLTEQYWNRLGFWVIPSDTIEVIRGAGLISKIDYRPALATRINYYSAISKPTIRNLAFDIATQRSEPRTVEVINLSDGDKVKSLNLAAEFIQYRYSRMELKQEEYQQQFLAVVKEKNRLDQTSQLKEIMPVPKSPDEGHLPGKASLGFGYANDSFFTEIGWRPAYHSIQDPLPGYKEGAQLNVFDIKGRYYEKNSALKLQSFHLVDMISLAPSTMFISPMSWKFNTGLDQQQLRDGDEHLVYRLNGGGGVAYNTGGLGIIYGMMEADFIAGDSLDNKVDLGIGFTAGSIKQIREWWQTSFQFRWLYYSLSENSALYQGDLIQTFMVSRNNAITLQTGFDIVPGRFRPAINLGWNYYF